MFGFAIIYGNIHLFYDLYTKESERKRSHGSNYSRQRTSEKYTISDDLFLKLPTGINAIIGNGFTTAELIMAKLREGVCWLPEKPLPYTADRITRNRVRIEETTPKMQVNRSSESRLAIVYV